jgi:hypothetical protein
VLSGIEMGEWITLETTGAVWAGEAVERVRGLGTTVEGDEVEEIRLPARHIPSNCGPLPCCSRVLRTGGHCSQLTQEKYCNRAAGQVASSRRGP